MTFTPINLFTLAVIVCSADAADFFTSFGLSIVDFQYEEENLQGDILDLEDGSLQGLFIDLEARSGKWFINGAVETMRGDVDYVAYPSSNIELNSQTSESMKNQNLALGYSQEISEKLKMEYFGGLGLRIWNRNIHSLPSIPGLDETYEWPYFSLGIRPIYHINSASKVDFLLRAKRSFNATLDVEFKNEVYDPVKLDLNDGQGLEVEVNWLQSIDRNTSIGFGPYLHLWWFDESDSFALTKNGAAVGTVFEPANYTRSLGFHLFLRKHF